MNTTATGIIELNDHQLKLSIGDQHWLSSGFATLTPNGVLFGEDSQQQTRLQPRVSYNQYWNQLSLAPIDSPNDKFRHYGDFAHQQLLDLVHSAESCSEIILSVPASFDREQLALLLGICQHCPFEVIGLVDSSVAAIADKAVPGHHIYLDIQLHQCLLTEVVVDSQLEVKSADVIAGCGLVHLYQHWAKYLAAQFIQQCRFDPLHEASTEQQLYNMLEQLLNPKDDDIQLSIGDKQIKLTRQSLARHTQSLFEPVLSAISHAGQTDNIWVSERVAAIPALFGQLNNPITIDKHAIASNGLKHKANICPDGKDLSFISQLPVSQTAIASVLSKADSSKPTTHVLLHNAAYPIGQKPIFISTDNQIRLSTVQPGQAQFSISKNAQNLTLSVLNGSEVLVNGKQGNNGASLSSGDTLSFTNTAESLTLINVVEDNNW